MPDGVVILANAGTLLNDSLYVFVQQLRMQPGSRLLPM